MEQRQEKQRELRPALKINALRLLTDAAQVRQTPLDRNLSGGDGSGFVMNFDDRPRVVEKMP
jgi:hypothetical protein